MLITPIVGYAKSLFQSIIKPQTYGSALEAYIVSNNPQNTIDIEYLQRKFDTHQATTAGWII